MVQNDLNTIPCLPIMNFCLFHSIYFHQIIVDKNKHFILTPSLAATSSKLRHGCIEIRSSTSVAIMGFCDISRRWRISSSGWRMLMLPPDMVAHWHTWFIDISAPSKPITDILMPFDLAYSPICRIDRQDQ